MASTVYAALMEELKQAMKAHESDAVNAIRGVIAKAKDLTVNAGKEMTDEVVLQVLAKGVKQREESIAQFEAAGRLELAERERQEKVLLQRYLPQALSEAEVASLVQEVVTAMQATSKKDMGRVMKEVLGRAQGRADGQLVSRLVGAALA